MAPQRMPAPVYVLDEAAVEKINSTSEAVAAIQLTLGVYSPDGKAGTGLVGQVVEMRGEVNRLVALRNMGRGFLAGAVVVAAIAMLGLADAIKAIGFTALH